jgi:hypothetical protein
VARAAIAGGVRGVAGVWAATEEAAVEEAEEKEEAEEEAEAEAEEAEAEAEAEAEEAEAEAEEAHTWRDAASVEACATPE